MSYETAKEVLRKNIDVMMQNPNKTAHDYLMYDFGKALFDLIEAVQVDLAEIKAKIDRLAGVPPHPQ